jgi:hypothetical protein
MPRSYSTASSSTIGNDHNKASGESSYPAEGAAADAGGAQLTSRKPPPDTPHHTAKVVHHNVSGHAALQPWRPRTPSRKEPAPHWRRCRRRTLQLAERAEVIAARRRLSSAGAQLDLPFNDLDPTADPSLEPVRMPPAARSPPSFHGGEDLGEKMACHRPHRFRAHWLRGTQATVSRRGEGVGGDVGG